MISVQMLTISSSWYGTTPLPPTLSASSPVEMRFGQCERPGVLRTLSIAVLPSHPFTSINITLTKDISQEPMLDSRT